MFFVLLQQLYILIIYYLFIYLFVFLCVFIFVHMEQIWMSLSLFIMKVLGIELRSPDWSVRPFLTAIPLNPAIHLKDSFVHSFVTR